VLEERMLPTRPQTFGGLQWSIFHLKKIADYRRLIIESERDPLRNEIQHKWLLKLLADEEATEILPLNRRY
jgi:hypothetical protein